MGCVGDVSRETIRAVDCMNGQMFHVKHCEYIYKMRFAMQITQCAIKCA